MARETPSSVMYGDLRTFARITNKEAARALLDLDVAWGGEPIRSRLESRTWLFRNVTSADPSHIPPLAPPRRTPPTRSPCACCAAWRPRAATGRPCAA